MAQTVSMATPKCVRAGRSGQEFNRGRFTLFKLPAVLCRSENQPSRAIRYRAIGNSGDFETVIVVGGCDLELNFGPTLYVNW
jgi:hypothetical protein